MKDFLQKIKVCYNSMSISTLLLFTPVILFLSSLVVVREYKFLYLISSLLTLIYKFMNGYRPKMRDIALWISIFGGAYISYRAYPIGFLSVVLGLLTGFILITTYDVIEEEGKVEQNKIK